ncbi:hypothetical protein SALB1_3479 [Salinisphaera sp. LB1]|nr:hypothetical protein SALB1_3479 [Salinisphaera sp. LB1]
MSVEEFNIWLIDHQYEIKAPKEGDFVLMHSSEWHIGYMVDHERFMHCSRDLGAAMVSDINRNEYRNSIQGFYRVDI